MRRMQQRTERSVVYMRVPTDPRLSDRTGVVKSDGEGEEEGTVKDKE